MASLSSATAIELAGFFNFVTVADDLNQPLKKKQKRAEDVKAEDKPDNNVMTAAEVKEEVVAPPAVAAAVKVKEEVVAPPAVAAAVKVKEEVVTLPTVMESSGSSAKPGKGAIKKRSYDDDDYKSPFGFLTREELVQKIVFRVPFSDIRQRLHDIHFEIMQLERFGHIALDERFRLSEERHGLKKELQRKIDHGEYVDNPEEYLSSHAYNMVLERHVKDEIEAAALQQKIAKLCEQ